MKVIKRSRKPSERGGLLEVLTLFGTFPFILNLLHEREKDPDCHQRIPGTRPKKFLLRVFRWIDPDDGHIIKVQFSFNIKKPHWWLAYMKDQREGEYEWVGSGERYRRRVSHYLSAGSSAEIEEIERLLESLDHPDLTVFDPDDWPMDDWPTVEELEGF